MMKPLFLSLALLFSASAQAYEPFAPDNAPMALKGLQGVGLVINGFREDFTRFGLDIKQLQQQLEGKLSRSGLQIRSPEQAAGNVEDGVLELRLYANKNEYGFYSYYLALKMHDQLNLPRAQARLPVQTWSDGRNGIFLPHEVAKLGQLSTELVTEFVRQYQVQNP